MRRRDFVLALGGLAATWPCLASAQPAERVRRVGVLVGSAANDPDQLANLSAFAQGLRNSGWIAGSNLEIETRWLEGDAVRARVYAQELVGLGPEVLVSSGLAALTELKSATQTIPIVFARVSEPLGQGLVTSLAHPGGNVTGFTNFESTMGSKWLQTLKAVVPAVSHVWMVGNPVSTPVDFFSRSMAEASATLKIATDVASAHILEEIEQVFAVAGAIPGGGVIVLPDPLTIRNRSAVIAMAAKHRVPAIYPFRSFADDGGLVSYGIDTNEQLRGVAGYVDRILRGAKPGDLPVQQPTKFEYVINLRTAKTLGVAVSDVALRLADEVIE